MLTKIERALMIGMLGLIVSVLSFVAGVYSAWQMSNVVFAVLVVGVITLQGVTALWEE